MKRSVCLTKVLRASTLVLLLAACSMSTGNDDEATDELLRAQRRWATAGVQDYQIVVQNLCFCGYTRPVRVTVRFGSVVSRVDAETGEPAPAHANARDIPGLFDLIRDAIDRDAYSLSVTYDAAYGFPLQINIDYIGNAVDDELQVKASDFQPQR